MNMDALFDAVADKGPVCVGLDTAVDYIPNSVLQGSASAAEAMLAFNKAIVDATLPYAGCFKVQIAYYEEQGLAGLAAYAQTIRYARSKGALVIADIKRGDIADTATRYARAHFAGEFEADFVTLSPYMGMDSIEPWFSFAESSGKGAFVLMRTSNPGMRDFEYPELAAGGRVYDAIGDKLTDLAERRLGSRGYGAFGAVVGCTEREEAAEIRRKRDKLFFLIPGYGAQGGAAEDAARLMRNGNGGVVNASRSILRAWMKTSPDSANLDQKAALKAVADTAAAEAQRMRDAIRAACQSGADGVRP